MKNLMLVAVLVSCPIGASFGELMDLGPYPHPQPNLGCHKPNVYVNGNMEIYNGGRLLNPMGVWASGRHKEACPGIVAWLGTNNILYRWDDAKARQDENYRSEALRSDLTTARDFDINDYTGTIVWYAGSGDPTRLFKDGEELGSQAQGFKWVANTGDVVWWAQGGALFYNKTPIGSSVDVGTIQVETDGRVSWVSSNDRRTPHSYQP